MRLPGSTRNSAWASSVWLERANHNYFNEHLPDEAVARPGRPDCEPLLEPEAQRDFLSEYTVDFLAKILTRIRPQGTPGHGFPGAGAG